MITYQLDPSAEFLKSYTLPVKGTWKTLPAHLLPDTVVQESLNVTILDGKLRSRLGHKYLSSLGLFDGFAIGSFLFISGNTTKTILVSTASHLYQGSSSGFTAITGAVTLSSSAQQVRMTSIQDGTSVYLLYANGIDTLKYKQDLGNLQDITPHAGTIPVCSDICTAFSRIVGITPPYIVQWCDVLNNSYLSLTNWPALNQVVLSDTEDAIVAIRPLGTLGFAVYKEGNIFVGIAQSGAPSQAFRFEHRGEYEGPAGVQSIINVNGVHIYLTRTGRVGAFDGSQHQWICDGLWPYLRDDIDRAYVQNSFGVYNYRTNEIYFWYPRLGAGGALRGMLILSLTMPLAGITDVAYFLGRTQVTVSNALGVKLFESASDPYVFGTKSFVLDKTSTLDEESLFLSTFTSGLTRVTLQEPQKPLKPDIGRPILEFYATRDSARKLVNITALASNQLETAGAESEPVIIDLSVLSPNEYIGFNHTGSFLGFKASWLSDALVEYKGCDVYVRKTQ